MAALISKLKKENREILDNYCKLYPSLGEEMKRTLSKNYFIDLTIHEGYKLCKLYGFNFSIESIRSIFDFNA